MGAEENMTERKPRDKMILKIKYTSTVLEEEKSRKAREKKVLGIWQCISNGTYQNMYVEEMNHYTGKS